MIVTRFHGGYRVTYEFNGVNYTVSAFYEGRETIVAPCEFDRLPLNVREEITAGQ